MSTFVASTAAPVPPDAVLAVLTDPDACRRWAPVDFRVSGLDGGRLSAGSRAQVRGEFAGRPVAFDVEVRTAEPGRLELRADGPVGLDVRYDVAPAAGGSEVTATIAVRRRHGLIGQVLASASSALLAGGLLDQTVRRIAREAAVA